MSEAVERCAGDAGAGGGAIVNTASTAGLGGAPHLVAYGASKHAVIGITRTAALEFARGSKAR